MGKKRGQVTVFIIAGIMLLIGIALLLFMQRTIFSIGYEKDVPKDVLPLYRFIDSCIEDISDEDIERIGFNGGYLEFPPEINQFSSIRLHPQIEDKIPYWWYDGEERMPTDEFVQYQLGSSMKKRLLECTANFSDFKDEFSIKEIEQMKVDVTLAANDVVYDVIWPMEVKAGSQSTNLDRFSISKPVRVKKMFSLAREIMQHENRNLWFEEFTMDLINIDEDVPDTNFEFRCAPRIWLVNNVKKRIKDLLTVNIPLAMVEGTNTYDIGDEYAKNHFTFSPTDNEYPTTSVSFSYDHAKKMEFTVRPSNGVVMKSGLQKGGSSNNDAFDVDLSFMCLQIYHFTYDIEYPLAVSITDDETNRNDEFILNFAFPVIIDHNVGDKRTIAKMEYNIETAADETDYCNASTRKASILTWNNVTREPVDDVNISFECFKYKCGNIGATEYSSNNAVAALETNLPLCYSGVIKTKREGYKDAKTIIDTSSEEGIFDIDLTPIVEFYNYTVEKYEIEAPNLALNLYDNEQALIMLKHPSGHTSFGIFPQENDQEDRLPIVLLSDDEYTYQLKIYLIKDNALAGGYDADWKVTRNELRNSDSIKFSLISTAEDIPQNDDELPANILAFFDNMKENSKQVPAPKMG